MSCNKANEAKGCYEAFANMYRGGCRHYDGVEGLLSAEACVQSDKEENTWAEMDRGSYRYTKLTHPNKNISEAGCLNA